MVKKTEDDLITEGLLLIVAGVKLGDPDKVIAGIKTFSDEPLEWGQDRPKSRLEDIKARLQTAPKENVKKGRKSRKDKIEVFQPEDVEPEIVKDEILGDQFGLITQKIQGGKRFGGRQPMWHQEGQNFDQGKIEVITSAPDEEEIKQNAILAKKTPKPRRAPIKSILETRPMGLDIGNTPPNRDEKPYESPTEED